MRQTINHRHKKKKKKKKKSDRWKCEGGVVALLMHDNDFNRQIDAAEAQSVTEAVITMMTERRNKQQYLQ